MRAPYVVAGLVVVLGTWSSVIRTLVVPRGLTSKVNAFVNKLVRATFHLVAHRFDRYETRDRILVAQGPTILLSQLVVWVVLFLVGFWLLFAGTDSHSMAEAFRESGSALFTLGYAPVGGAAPTIVTFAAAATGLVVVALQIGYLPTLYGAFNRRETLVTTLSSRAGSPAWGPELLARHQIVATLDSLPSFYAEWERWAADLAESHSNYPVLVTFRSPNPYRSWIVGLIAVMDSAAMRLALNPSARTSEARLCLRMGFVSLRDVCAAIGVPFDPDPRPDDPIRLTYDDFLVGVARLQTVGYEIERTPEEAWPHFRGWRVNYEAQAYALASKLDAVPAIWSGPRHHAPEALLPVRPPNRTPDKPEGT
jgi:hypothetical protein